MTGVSQTEARERSCRHHWTADGDRIRCAACETELFASVSDTGIRFGPDGRQVNDLADRSRQMAHLLAVALNELAAKDAQ